MTLINDHVLFPFAPTWKSRPQYSRSWENEISGGMLGNETRRSLRSAPRRQLSFELINLSLIELTDLNEAILAAKKFGLACAPFHGRAQTHLLATEDNLVQLVETGWTWRANDYIFLRSPDDSFEVAKISEVNLDMGVRQLTLDAPLENVYPAGAFCWPMIFGKLLAEDASTGASRVTQTARTPRVGPVRITISELVSPAATQIGEITPSGADGIGVMKIADDFAVA